LNQQVEIASFSVDEAGKPVWKKQSIEERQEKIVRFSIDTWSLDDIKLDV